MENLRKYGELIKTIFLVKFKGILYKANRDSDPDL